MNRIGFPRWDVYGQKYEKDELERWYVSAISSEIYDRLKKLSVPPYSDEEKLRDRIIHQLPQILLMPPKRMERYANAVSKLYGHILTVKPPKAKRKSTPFGAALLEAFHYSTYRKNILVKLTAWLNVKTCPYCNMSYTLYSELVLDKKTVPNCDRITRFQFDHFFSKMEYPMLSMCLYNLIPSCPVCNQGKSERNLPLIFHPYCTDIQSLFTFKVKRPLPGFVGARFVDYVPVELEWKASVLPKQSEKYEKAFHLGVLYSRHGDVVEEVYDKAFEEPYYTNPANFSYLSGCGIEYLKRLWFSDYMTPEKTDRRPLSKFKQDTFAQALQEKEKLRRYGLLP